jgi:phospholipid/cholesterol/gamma-HCH transport system substrate-binding protein
MSRVARLGAFIVATLAILAAGVFVIGGKEYLFSSTYQLKAQFDNVEGLATGADVQVGGVHSGNVYSIALPNKPGGRVTVVMELDKKTHEIVKQDSVASIETEGVLGNQFMAISFGSAGQADVKNGDTLQSTTPLAMADLLKKTNNMLDSSQQAILNTVEVTAHLSSVSAKIDAGQGTVGALVNDKRIYSNLQQATSTLNDTTKKAQAGVTDFQENMEALKHNFLLSGYFKKRGYEDSTDLIENEIEGLPSSAPNKTFTFSPAQLFADRDSTKLQNRNSLNEAGEYLANTAFGFAVVAVSAGPEGDSSREMLITEARAMVIRAYLVDHFGFDDSRLRTLGLGKQAGSPTGAGTIQILVFPAGSEEPVKKHGPTGIASKAVVNDSAHGSSDKAEKQ